MDVTTFIRLLEGVRDHLTIAIRDAERGDVESAREEVETAGKELVEAGEALQR